MASTLTWFHFPPGTPGRRRTRTQHAQTSSPSPAVPSVTPSAAPSTAPNPDTDRDMDRDMDQDTDPAPNLTPTASISPSSSSSQLEHPKEKSKDKLKLRLEQIPEQNFLPDKQPLASPGDMDVGKLFVSVWGEQHSSTEGRPRSSASSRSSTNSVISISPSPTPAASGKRSLADCSSAIDGQDKLLKVSREGSWQQQLPYRRRAYTNVDDKPQKLRRAPPPLQRHVSASKIVKFHGDTNFHGSDTSQASLNLLPSPVVTPRRRDKRVIDPSSKDAQYLSEFKASYTDDGGIRNWCASLNDEASRLQYGIEIETTLAFHQSLFPESYHLPASGDIGRGADIFSRRIVKNLSVSQRQMLATPPDKKPETVSTKPNIYPSWAIRTRGSELRMKEMAFFRRHGKKVDASEIGQKWDDDLLIRTYWDEPLKIFEQIAERENLRRRYDADWQGVYVRPNLWKTDLRGYHGWTVVNDDTLIGAPRAMLKQVLSERGLLTEEDGEQSAQEWDSTGIEIVSPIFEVEEVSSFTEIERMVSLLDNRKEILACGFDSPFAALHVHVGFDWYFQELIDQWARDDFMASEDVEEETRLMIEEEMNFDDGDPNKVREQRDAQRDSLVETMRLDSLAAEIIDIETNWLANLEKKKAGGGRVQDVLDYRSRNKTRLIKRLKDHALRQPWSAVKYLKKYVMSSPSNLLPVLQHLAYIWLQYEHLIISLVPKHKRGTANSLSSVHCRSNKQHFLQQLTEDLGSNPTVREVQSAIWDREPRSVAHLKNRMQSSRDFMLNFENIAVACSGTGWDPSSIRTVEFRAHEGTQDAVEIEMFIQLCVSIVRAAEAMVQREISYHDGDKLELVCTTEDVSSCGWGAYEGKKYRLKHIPSSTFEQQTEGTLGLNDLFNLLDLEDWQRQYWFARQRYFSQQSEENGLAWHETPDPNEIGFVPVKIPAGDSQSSHYNYNKVDFGGDRNSAPTTPSVEQHNQDNLWRVHRGRDEDEEEEEERKRRRSEPKNMVLR